MILILDADLFFNGTSTSIQQQQQQQQPYVYLETIQEETSDDLRSSDSDDRSDTRDDDEDDDEDGDCTSPVGWLATDSESGSVIRINSIGKVF